MTQAGSRTKDGVPAVVVALDFSDVESAIALVDELGELCRFYKIGSELFTTAGPDAVSRVRAAGCDVMLDLKFHDIPNTVAGAVGSARGLGVRLLTIHAAGGDAMIRAAVQAAGGECLVFAVTILTSLSGPDVSAVWGREGTLDMSREVVRLATQARDAGASGVVASGSEVEAIKGSLGSALQVLVPGVRPAGTAAGDQRRVVTPAEARRLGADYVVVGRAVTGSGDRRGALEQILQELDSSA
ncbi:MAG: orotidine-5'-phosphate decarboxylase [Gemmatimonadota bacterium]|nr:orotidine-5'-phosphate decarboxylase [Gemmatimonadota bacterium]